MSRRWVVLGVLSAGLALISLDNTIVNVALPSMQEDLDATTADLQWVVDAYSVLSSVPRERSGLGSAVNDAMGELGGSFGVAILGAVMSVFYRENVEAAISSLGDRAASIPMQVLDGVREALASAPLVAQRLPEAYAAPVHDVTGAAFVTGMTWALLVGAVIVLVGLGLAWRMFPVRLERVEE